MGIFFNNVGIGQGSSVYINNVAAQNVFFNNTLIWQKSATVSNLLTNEDEKSHVWQDVGVTSGKLTLKSFYAPANTVWYVRANLGCWAYGRASGAIYINDWYILWRNATEGLDGSTQPCHAIVYGDNTTKSLLLDYRRPGGASQGYVWTTESMVVDVTALNTTDINTIWSKLGYFRGNKTVNL